jgi:hypothetical protein
MSRVRHVSERIRRPISHRPPGRGPGSADGGIAHRQERFPVLQATGPNHGANHWCGGAVTVAAGTARAPSHHSPARAHRSAGRADEQGTTRLPAITGSVPWCLTPCTLAGRGHAVLHRRRLRREHPHCPLTPILRRQADFVMLAWAKLEVLASSKRYDWCADWVLCAAVSAVSRGREIGVRQAFRERWLTARAAA